MQSYSKDDSQTVTPRQVESIVRKLCVSYAHLRRSFIIQEKLISKYLDEGDVAGAVKGLLLVFRIPNAFTKRIGFNATGLPTQAFAAMLTKHVGENPRPISGTMLFVQPKAEVLKNPQYRLIHVMAHELSHVRMFLDVHELSYSEFATDVLALLVTGNATDFSTNMQTIIGQYGYIRPDLYDELFRCLDRYAETMYFKN